MFEQPGMADIGTDLSTLDEDSFQQLRLRLKAEEARFQAEEARRLKVKQEKEVETTKKKVVECISLISDDEDGVTETGTAATAKMSMEGGGQKRIKVDRVKKEHLVQEGVKEEDVAHLLYEASPACPHLQNVSPIMTPIPNVCETPVRSKSRTDVPPTTPPPSAPSAVKSNLAVAVKVENDHLPQAAESLQFAASPSNSFQTPARPPPRSPHLPPTPPHEEEAANDGVTVVTGDAIEFYEFKYGQDASEVTQHCTSNGTGVVKMENDERMSQGPKQKKKKTAASSQRRISESDSDEEYVEPQSRKKGGPRTHRKKQPKRKIAISEASFNHYEEQHREQSAVREDTIGPIEGPKAEDTPQSSGGEDLSPVEMDTTPSDGWECPRCTLVNQPSHLMCDACRAPKSLRGNETVGTDADDDEFFQEQYYDMLANDSGNANLEGDIPTLQQLLSPGLF
ncbi:hypothetical protein HDV00_005112 [Rhizophlyctis rosea]|nr:hypothetical protein HDV00_005112 [Rhizophlyctis rosea]